MDFGRFSAAKLEADIEDLQSKISRGVSDYVTTSEQLAAEQEKLSQVNADRTVSKRAARMTDMVERLQGAFGSGVRGRLVDLCTPKQCKYNVAMTMVMGK